MYCSYLCLLAEEGSDPPKFIAPEEGQEPDPSEINLLCQESFNEDCYTKFYNFVLFCLKFIEERIAIVAFSRW